MNKNSPNRLCPARPSEVKMLGGNLVDQLLKVEDSFQGPEQFKKKKEIISNFEKNDPDLFQFFQSGKISPYQLLVQIQKAFEDQSDVIIDGNIVSKRDAVLMLRRYIPNLQYLHNNQLYTDADTFKDLGASLAIGVVVTGLTEAVGRVKVSNPFLSMELAIFETLSIAGLIFLCFIASRNRNFFHKAPWNSAIYIGANLYEKNPKKWEAITWKNMQQALNPFKGFTLLKKRPYYEELDRFYFRK